mgnify:CR=1 FL=1
MSALILCRSPLAKSPYLTGEGIRIFSPEELSFYIATHIQELDGRFMNLDLCHWIDSQANMHELAVKLRRLIQDRAPLQIFVGTLLLAIGYLSRQEVHEIVNAIAVLAGKGPGERRKMTCDRLLASGRYQEAIDGYRSLLADASEAGANPKIIGDLYHNMGTAYSRLFFYKEAGECFEKAFQKNASQTSLRAMFSSYYLRGDLDMVEIQSQRYHVAEEILESLASGIRALAEGTDLVSYGVDLNRMKEAGREEVLEEVHRLEEAYVRSAN